jgi:hypothetical protein
MMANHPSSNPGNAVPAAQGDVTVYHARTEVAHMDLVWDGVLLTFWSAESAQSVLEGFAVARAMLSSIPRELPPPPSVAEPFAQQTLAAGRRRIGQPGWDVAKGNAELVAAGFLRRGPARGDVTG